MRLALFIPCFIDHYFPQVGIAMVKIFEQLGHQVDYPADQTCCGQPAFNSGYWDQARPLARRMVRVFEKAEVVVSASGSCAAMVRIFNRELLGDEADALAAKTFEFSEFLVDRLGVTDLGARLHARATFHDGCHGLRELGLKRQARELLRHVKGLELVEMSEAETCCGFGGTFSVKFPDISNAMAEVKCASINETGADLVISNDSSCLMQIQGTLTRQGQKIRCLHLAEVLASH